MKKVMLGGAFVAALAVGGGGAYTYQYTDLFGLKGNGGLAPTIKAAVSPVKILKQKSADAGGSINKVMHKRLSGGSSSEKSAGDTADKLLNKPKDNAVNLTNRIAGANSGMLPGQSTTLAGGARGTNVPRRVKTLIVRPDGTILRPAGRDLPKNVGEVVKNVTLSPGVNADSIPKAGEAAKTATGGIRRMKTIRQVSNVRRLSGDTGKSVKKLAIKKIPRQVKTSPSVIKNASTVLPKIKPVRPVKPARVRATPSGEVGVPFVVQVTSRSSQTSALAAFADMQQKYPSLIGAFGPDIQRADLGAKGVWYRLRVGPVGSKTAASDLCSSLKQAGHPGCFVRRKK